MNKVILEIDRNEWLLLSTSFITLIGIGFILMSTEITYVSLWKRTRDFKKVLRLRYRHIFVTITEDFERLQYCNFEKCLLQAETLFKKVGYDFSVKNTTTENRIFQSKTIQLKKTILRQIEWWAQKGRIERIEFCHYFFKFNLSIITSREKLI